MFTGTIEPPPPAPLITDSNPFTSTELFAGILTACLLLLFLLAAAACMMLAKRRESERAKAFEKKWVGQDMDGGSVWQKVLAGRMAPFASGTYDTVETQFMLPADFLRDEKNSTCQAAVSYAQAKEQISGFGQWADPSRLIGSGGKPLVSISQGSPSKDDKDKNSTKIDAESEAPAISSPITTNPLTNLVIDDSEPNVEDDQIQHPSEIQLVNLMESSPSSRPYSPANKKRTDPVKEKWQEIMDLY
mmetsp:Transcript_12845/g.17554  ORF Transcript_12845/g.17554 Transcript_12845/m.17554 type:complete len:246 (-) Transcript_12845:67-804(-)